MTKLSLVDLSLSGQRVFMRVDFNVPMANGDISDDSRIRAALPSINHVVQQRGRLILASHMGRPKNAHDPLFSLQPVRRRLEDLMGASVGFVPTCTGTGVVDAVNALQDGSVLLLENLRFHPEEITNDTGFSQALAQLCDVYVNNAFGVAHRAHASTTGITFHVDRSAAGFLMQKELESLNRVLKGADRPYVSIVGGSKISGKIELIENFLKIADDVLIGGAMAYTFLRARGIETGKSLVEEGHVSLASDLLNLAEGGGRRIRLPEDHVVARNFEGYGTRVVSIIDTSAREMGLDIGPRTVSTYNEVIAAAKTIVWNGPMGVFENPKFAEGTFAIGRAIAASDAFSIVGGGDSAAAVNQLGLVGQISHVSTGGGAALEFLSGRKLPGVDVLTDKE